MSRKQFFFKPFFLLLFFLNYGLGNSGSPPIICTVWIVYRISYCTRNRIVSNPYRTKTVSYQNRIVSNSYRMKSVSYEIRIVLKPYRIKFVSYKKPYRIKSVSKNNPYWKQSVSKTMICQIIIFAKLFDSTSRARHA